MLRIVMRMEITRTSRLALLLISATLSAQQEPPLPSVSGSADLEALSHGVYYRSQQGWKKLDGSSSSGFKTTHGASALAGVPPGVVRLYAGPEAANQFESHRPVLGIREDASRPDLPGFTVRDLLIVRVAKKKDHRELEVMEGSFASQRVGLNPKDIVEATLTTVSDRTFTLAPKSDLARGEYVLTLRGANGTVGYDFGIRG
jgi:hypothetical protein